MPARITTVLALLLFLLLPGCYTSSGPRKVADAPAYTRSAEHYVALDGAAALGAYLRVDSGTGPLVSAHRGGPMPGYPENAIATFEHTLRYAPALIECDVRYSRDSALVMMHDPTLERTTTGSGAVNEHSFAELRRLLLVDERGVITPFRIPTLSETLAWADGRAVLTLDVKDIEPAHVIDAIRRHHAEDRVVVIVYTLDELLRYQRLAPDLVYSATAETAAEAQALLERAVDPNRLIVFTGVGEVHPDVIALLHAHNIRAMLGTFDTIDERARANGPDVYQALLDRGVDVIATDVVPVAARAAERYVPATQD